MTNEELLTEVQDRFTEILKGVLFGDCDDVIEESRVEMDNFIEGYRSIVIAWDEKIGA